MIAIVGPSGVGKDSVMAGLRAEKGGIGLVRRVITRAPDPDGENHISLSVDEFEHAKTAGDYILDWQAHGLNYAIPKASLGPLMQGGDMLINLSRNVLLDANSVFENFVVVNLTASPDVLRARLQARGRETKEDIEKRIARAVDPLPAALTTHMINNDHSIEITIKTIIDCLDL